MQAHLSHRSVIRLSGADVDSFLQGIITQDIGLLASQPLIYSAMLSPQGKCLYDFFILADGDDRLIDIDANFKDAFITSLKRYKLRSKVSIEETDLQVFAAWGEPPKDNVHWHRDPRLETLGWRRVSNSSGGHPDGNYEAHRLSFAVPDGARDATDRYFALELGYDQLNGVSFTKGCFVGQEPTARMHYRSVLRKGLFAVRANHELPPAGTPIVAGEKNLGEMRSSCGQLGLAFCRFDPVQSAQESSEIITANSSEIHLSIPAYMQEKWALIAAASEA